MPGNPWLSWDYVTSSWDELSSALVDHALLTVEAVLVALVVSLPLAALASRVRWLAGPVLAVTSALYTIPSLALFAILAPLLGIGRTSVLVGLVLYALVLLVRNTLAGLRSVDPAVLDAARGLGYGPVRRFWSVEVPGALPGIVAGVRLATVSTVALVTVGVVVGYGGLGTFILRGFQSFYRAEILTATLLCLLLALVLDVAIWLLGRLLMPWRRGARG